MTVNAAILLLPRLFKENEEHLFSIDKVNILTDIHNIITCFHSVSQNLNACS